MLSRTLLLVGAAVCSSAIDVIERDVPHITHDGHIDGFTMDHAWVMEQGQLVKYNLGQGRMADVQAFESFDPNVRSAARTRSLAKLALIAAYQGQQSVLSYPQAAIDPIIAAGDGSYNTASYAADVAALVTTFNALLKEVTDAVAAGSTWTNVTSPVTALVAFGFRTPANVHVLVYRGSVTLVDRVDISAMTIPWLSSGHAKTKARTAWEKEAGLPWGTTQINNAKIDATADRTILRDQGKIAVVGLFTQLERALSPNGAAPFVIQVALQWITSVRRISGAKAAITGHSLGGARAAAAAIAIKERQNFVVQTVTFGGTGAACWPRRNFFGTSLLNTTHDMSNIVEYVHPLDTYGNMLGRDLGQTCWLGKTNIAASKAKKYCEVISGLDPAYLMRVEASTFVQRYIVGARAQLEVALTRATASGNAALITAVRTQQAQFEGLIALIPGFTKFINATEQAHNAAHIRCRYFTHDPLALYNLVVAELTANGQTQSGCSYFPAVEYGNDQCPFNYPTPAEDDDDFWTGKPGGPVFGVFIGLTFIALIVALAMCASSPSESESEIDEDEVREDEVEEMEEKDDVEKEGSQE